MEEQGGGIGLKQLGRLGANRHQGIGHQQAAAGLVEATHVLEAAQAQVHRPQRIPEQLVPVGQAVLEQGVGAAGRKTQPSQGQAQGEAPLAWAHPHLGPREGPGQGRQGQLVLQPRTGGQHNRCNGPMGGLQLAQLGQQLPGGGHGSVEQQALAQPQHGHADRHGHVEDPLELLKTPDLAGHQFPHQGGAPAVGIERQQGPPGPVLIHRGRHAGAPSSQAEPAPESGPKDFAPSGGTSRQQKSPLARQGGW